MSNLEDSIFEDDDNDYSFDVTTEWSTDQDGTLHHATETNDADKRIARDLAAGIPEDRIGRRELLNQQLRLAVEHETQQAFDAAERPLSADVADHAATLNAYALDASSREEWPRKAPRVPENDGYPQYQEEPLADWERELLGISHEVDPDILEIALEGRKISAIKVYRDRYGTDLRTAKKALDLALASVNDHNEGCVTSFRPTDPVRYEEPSEPPIIIPSAEQIRDSVIAEPETYANDFNATGVVIPLDYTLYVSGPMRGFPEYNYPLFNGVTERLRAAGYLVKNPAENFYPDPPGSHGFEEYMALDIQSVTQSNGVVLLPGWEKSEGARFEIAVAKLLGLDFYEWDVPSATFHRMDIPSSESEGIDAIARKLVYGDRNESYGPPAHDFECTGRKWAATLSAHTGTHFDDIPPEIVAVMMADLKTSRLGTNPTHFDSRVDVIGYILCLDRIITGK